MAEIVDLATRRTIAPLQDGTAALSTDADTAISYALAESLEHVVIIGQYADGTPFRSASMMNIPNMNFMIDEAKQWVMRLANGDEE